MPALRVLIVAGAVALVGLLVFGRFLRPRPPLPLLGQVGSFTLTNQLGLPFGSSNLAGRIWVADIIFTRCPGPCLRMSTNFAQLAATLPAEDRVMLVSLTADPAVDTPEMLRRYGEKFGARPDRWQFLTGRKDAVYAVAMQQLRLAVEEQEAGATVPPEDLFIHSTRLVLVDRQGRLRGVYEGAEPGNLGALRGDLRRLLREGG
jgi:protein SCO1/2